MKNKWYEILWGNKEEDEILQRLQGVEQKLHGMGDITEEPAFQRDADPDELTLENAYKTRWIWYHTILGLLMLLTNVILIGIFTLLAVKL